MGLSLVGRGEGDQPQAGDQARGLPPTPASLAKTPQAEARTVQGLVAKPVRAAAGRSAALVKGAEAAAKRSKQAPSHASPPQGSDARQRRVSSEDMKNNKCTQRPFPSSPAPRPPIRRDPFITTSLVQRSPAKRSPSSNNNHDYPPLPHLS